jgi:hypothetical protein
MVSYVLIFNGLLNFFRMIVAQAKYLIITTETFNIAGIYLILIKSAYN